MEAVAKLKNCPISARKMRMVADVVRGKNVNDALNILRFTKREGAIYIEKVVLSAVANWENKNDLADADEAGLFLKTSSTIASPSAVINRTAMRRVRAIDIFNLDTIQSCQSCSTPPNFGNPPYELRTVVGLALALVDPISFDWY